jgi:hypothetical protein
LSKKPQLQHKRNETCLVVVSFVLYLTRRGGHLIRARVAVAVAVAAGGLGLAGAELMSPPSPEASGR